MQGVVQQVFCVPLYKCEKMQQQGSTCVNGTDFVPFFDEQSTDGQTDIHTSRVLTAIQTIGYCKIQTAQRVGGGSAVVATVCDKS